MSPQGLFRYFSAAQLQSAFDVCVEQMNSGVFTNLSGAQKSSSVEWLALDKRLSEINAEMDRRNGTARVQKVVQKLC